MEGKVSVGECFAIAGLVTVAGLVAGQFMTPKGARWFSKGKNGETALMFDPASKPASGN